jgi:hypothetical protein
LEKKINARLEELRQEISAFRDKINAGQAEFEERVTCMSDTQLKAVTTRDEQQAQERRDETWNLREGFNKELLLTRDEFRCNGRARYRSHKAGLRDVGCQNEAHR